MTAGKDEAVQGPKKNILYLLGAIGVAVMAYSLFVGDSGTTQVQAPEAPAAVERGSDQINDIGTIDRDASLAQFHKQIEALNEKLERNEIQRINDKKEYETKLREVAQQSNNEFRTIAESVNDLNKQVIEDQYANLNKLDQGTPVNLPGTIPDSGLSLEDFDLGSTSMEAEQPAILSNQYGPGYFVLNPNRQGFSSKPSGGAELYATEDQMFAGMGSPDGGSSGASTQYASTNQTAQAQTAQPQHDNQYPQGEPENPDVKVDRKGVTREKYKIPAFSYVEVTTLHGVACPVGASSPNASKGGNTPNARPVVLPVRGIFRGPNGAERDLGNIHIMGLCSGNRTASSKTGRATIRVEQLSYWDEFGEPQHLPALGYIVDNRDNQQDVYGRLEKASGRTLALQSAAAAAAAYATTLSQAEFTTSSTLSTQGGTNTQSQLTGSAAQAAVAQGIGQGFKEISDRFRAEADAMHDTVIVEPGIKLKFITEQPIEVFKPAEPFDVDADRYDVLI